MLSVATVRSAKGASGYFAADNYYATGEPDAVGEWFGKGAEALGLEGAVEQTSFEALLVGKLPNDVQLGSAERHRAGIDLTFSLPKSWSLLALVGGDRRILEVYTAAVKDTLRWAERNAAATATAAGGSIGAAAIGSRPKDRLLARLRVRLLVASSALAPSAAPVAPPATNMWSGPTPTAADLVQGPPALGSGARVIVLYGSLSRVIAAPADGQEQDDERRP